MRGRQGKTTEFEWTRFIENGHLDDQEGEMLPRRVFVIKGLKLRV